MDVRAKIVITKVAPDSTLTEQIEPSMRALGQAIGSRMQRLVPKRTWALHDTISVETVTSGAKVTTTVGAGSSDVGYALFVERGTSRMRAQPYMRPALLQTRAGDLNYRGKGVVTHGIVSTSTRRTRARRRTEGGSR
jgi:HK97 gp10 family phage protein